MHSFLKCYIHYSIFILPFTLPTSALWFGEFLSLEQFLPIQVSVKFVHSSYSFHESFPVFSPRHTEIELLFRFLCNQKVTFQGPQYSLWKQVITLKLPSFPGLYLIGFFSIKTSNYQNQPVIKMAFHLESLIHSISHYLSQIFLELIFSLTDCYLYI